MAWFLAFAHAGTALAVVFALVSLNTFYLANPGIDIVSKRLAIASGLLIVAFELQTAWDILYNHDRVQDEMILLILCWITVALQLLAYQLTSGGVRTLQERSLLAGLKEAIKHDQLKLFYQPIVDLRTEKIEGYEALVRWQHPKKGLLLPGEFIPATEKSPLVCELFEWVFRSAALQSLKWNYWISVNLSPSQIKLCDTEECVARILKDTLADSGQLHLELTETMLESQESAEHLVRALDKLGVKMVIDDFGVGYSCYSRLATIPIDLLKVDREFLPTGSKPIAIYRSIIELAHELNLKVIGEGIETREQADLLRDLGCDYGQGFYFGKPAPV